ncbi:MAG: hypothetical protein ABJH21_11115, partial [Parasphingorhabdus sp.]|uniref:hypothetical protein n=1 Tax=Parasphingorhabdus sp. TaxID=2709688 RepID=UPI003297DBBC
YWGSLSVHSNLCLEWLAARRSKNSSRVFYPDGVDLVFAMVVHGSQFPVKLCELPQEIHQEYKALHQSSIGLPDVEDEALTQSDPCPSFHCF